jgi:hypothetical protein
MEGKSVVRLAASLALAVLALAIASPQPAAQVEWEAELGAQILAEKECAVAFLSEVVRRELDEGNVTMAKVHCEDKRTFDAQRWNDDQDFEIRECEVPDVATC